MAARSQQPLGKANPNSFHNHSRAAVDVAPIPGFSFDAFVDGN